MNDSRSEIFSPLLRRWRILAWLQGLLVGVTVLAPVAAFLLIGSPDPQPSSRILPALFASGLLVLGCIVCVRAIQLSLPGRMLAFTGRCAPRIVTFAGDSTEEIAALAQTITRSLAGPATSEEEQWVKRIEALRKRLSASPQKIQMEDFGAGNPRHPLTKDEQMAGRKVERTVGAVCRSASKPAAWSWFLYRIVRDLHPSMCLELGTCLGISGLFQAAALASNGSGSLVTLEGAKALAEIARTNFQEMGLANTVVVPGRFQDTLAEVLRSHPPFDFAFIDGHHDESATIAYFRQIVPAMARTGILVVDDICWSGGMKRAWQTIAREPAVRFAMDLGEMGVIVVRNG